MQSLEVRQMLLVIAVIYHECFCDKFFSLRQFRILEIGKSVLLNVASNILEENRSFCGFVVETHFNYHSVRSGA